MINFTHGAVIVTIEPDDSESYLVICEVPNDTITPAEVAESCNVTDPNKFAYLSLEDWSLEHFLYEEGFTLSPTGDVSYDMDKAKAQAKRLILRELDINGPSLVPGRFPRLLMILQASLAPEDRNADFVNQFNTLKSEFDTTQSTISQALNATNPSELVAVFDPRNVTPFPQ